MRVFKFGGASVKDANGVKNVISVLEKIGHENILIVVSAMGKTTNALEVVIDKYLNDKENYKSELQTIKHYHHQIMLDLFGNTRPVVFELVNVLFKELLQFFTSNKSPNYNFIYDQVIGFGELVSTTIISNYLNEKHFNNTWLDVRQCIKTDDYYRSANVDWNLTQDIITKVVKPNTLYITQGFLGSDSNNFTTTLGREGSDYTAAIFAYCLNAESVTIWKDVPGVLNGDPRHFKNTQLLNTISYTEAIELAFYGASVIHPKTLQPLQRKEIPLHVKSFLNPENNGTTVDKSIGIEPQLPCFILKQNQVLLSLSTLDFSYVVEENISEIFNLLSHYKMKVDVIQNSAISFSVCIDNNYNNLEKLLLHLKAKFKVTCHENVSLYTIRHYDEASIKNLEKDKTVLLKQLFQQTVQIVTQ
ncbi:aspartate kinase [Lacinutrix sp. 5H-3-7-4]|uniref:aspartate kinase n=1 Tax=Lacinutrix sp. (strain 5H-3-7-4) TaxID=983544 RepID=UPI00020A32FC|nr:aspartate kinase [Lacinutrix sp. 5H-3-7-4]AEH00629.1 aspartate kinase [Lacinutrix sp. 5H-3-7-4]